MSFLKGKKKGPSQPLPKDVCVLPREKHNISRSLISPNALKVLYRLKNEGYDAYLVGGSVRDLLLGQAPKDFDIATDALPQKIKNCFRNGRLIGRRFKLVHVIFKGEIIEVSTFRDHFASDAASDQTEHGMVLRDNAYGTFEQDASRRDFTVNALYYNIADFSVVDFHNGIDDLNNGILRMIGEPEARYREDPVRLLRAMRLAAKLDFKIEPATEKPIVELGYLLTNVAPARLFTELLKLLLSGTSKKAYYLMKHYQLFHYLFPISHQCLKDGKHKTMEKFYQLVFEDTDERLADAKSVTPSYLLAALLWYPLKDKYDEISPHSSDKYQAMQVAITELLSEHHKFIAIPKRFTITMREIWLLQLRFEKLQPGKVYKVLAHPRFRAGYDFLALRARAGEPIEEYQQWWDTFYHNDSEARRKQVSQLRKNQNKKRKKRSKAINKESA